METAIYKDSELETKISSKIHLTHLRSRLVTRSPERWEVVFSGDQFHLHGIERIIVTEK